MSEPKLVLRPVHGADLMPPGGSYSTDHGVAVLVRFVVAEPALDDETALELARAIRRLGATQQPSLESFRRLLTEAWDLRGRSPAT